MIGQAYIPITIRVCVKLSFPNRGQIYMSLFYAKVSDLEYPRVKPLTQGVDKSCKLAIINGSVRSVVVKPVNYSDSRLSDPSNIVTGVTHLGPVIQNGWFMQVTILCCQLFTCVGC